MEDRLPSGRAARPARAPYKNEASTYIHPATLFSNLFLPAQLSIYSFAGPLHHVSGMHKETTRWPMAP
ncbi:hypothetical protein KTN05_16885 [Paracoccus sp. Z118]|uniref:hypothetical protein n=1 Tax=Paracoccus sp. Z118 TaxID=2851017 RepID=UPI001C2CBA49|nr:hypothetical protein [Paracoccus sp. Z118]MBV0893476.1 hypothetical protein [Paracoccus sp. Z118]